MIIIKKFLITDAECAVVAFDIRKKVFVEEQNVNAKEEFDEFEKFSLHYLVYYKGFPAGTARWRHTSNSIKLERFAVLKEYRSKKLGNRILNEILNDVIPFQKCIYLHSQLSAVNFYKKEGFKEKGDIFYECDIAHYLMSYRKKSD